MHFSWLFLLISICLCPIFIKAQKVPCRALEGTWKIENKDVYEEWETVTAHLLAGKGYKKKGDQIIITEYLTLQSKDGKVVYSATVPDQNNGATINFIMSNPDSKTWVFENPKHDFPQKIIYQHVLDNKIHVQVSGAGKKGFEYNMYRIDKKIPEWYQKEIEQSIGTWIADNKAYQSSAEPFDHYMLEWKKGKNEQEITGKMYGKSKDIISEPIWEFRQYWDMDLHEARVSQKTDNGITGGGTLIKDSDSSTLLMLEIKVPGGSGFSEKNIFLIQKLERINQSFRLDTTGKWIPNRSYKWIRKEQP